MSSLVDPYQAVLQVIRSIQDGRTLTRSCVDAGITTTAFKNWVAKSTEFQEMYAEAEQTGHDAMADALLEIENHELGSSDPKMAAVKSKNLMWYLSKRAIKNYGDRMTVEHTLTADKAITEALLAAKASHFQRNVPKTIEHIPTEIVGEIIDVVVDDWMKEFV